MSFFNCQFRSSDYIQFSKIHWQISTLMVYCSLSNYKKIKFFFLERTTKFSTTWSQQVSSTNVLFSQRKWQCFTFCFFTQCHFHRSTHGWAIMPLRPRYNRDLDMIWCCIMSHICVIFRWSGEPRWRLTRWRYSWEIPGFGKNPQASCLD